ncbi:endonuclease V [Halorubrum vacuolatum]|nr:endonuclease V [Halorubrum vacuolatum]
MEALQREIAAVARFEDDHGLLPERIALDSPFEIGSGLPSATQRTLVPEGSGDAGPIVVGIDQAFRGGGGASGTDDGSGESISAAVAIRDGRVIEYAHAVTPLSIPYIPGLLAFREGGPILAALDALSVEPDLLVLDGSGRIHYREAGIATHIGVIHDVPSIGVAKSLLCGDPDEPIDGRPAGWRTPIRADRSMSTVAEDEPVVGYAYQSRQYPNARTINPLYVSPGHRVSPSTAVDLIEALCAGYKLPEPTRLADASADAVTHGSR